MKMDELFDCYYLKRLWIILFKKVIKFLDFLSLFSFKMKHYNFFSLNEYSINQDSEIRLVLIKRNEKVIASYLTLKSNNL